MRFLYTAVITLYLLIPDIVCSHLTRQLDCFRNGAKVTIKNLNVDPARGLVQLPSTLVNASQQIASGCNSRWEY